jgi:uncharacterized protein (DUF39 family)
MNNKPTAQRTIEEINQKIRDGTALVMTAQELCVFTQKGRKINLKMLT